MTPMTGITTLRGMSETLDCDNGNTLAVFAEAETSLRSGIGPAEDDSRQPVEWALIAFDAFRSAVETQRTLMAKLIDIAAMVATQAATMERLDGKLDALRQECEELRAARRSDGVLRDLLAKAKGKGHEDG